MSSDNDFVNRFDENFSDARSTPLTAGEAATLLEDLVIFVMPRANMADAVRCFMMAAASLVHEIYPNDANLANKAALEEFISVQGTIAALLEAGKDHSFDLHSVPTEKN